MRIVEIDREHFEEIPERDLVKWVSNDSTRIQQIPNPSETVQLAAVKNFGLSIQFIKNPTEKVKIAAVMQAPQSIAVINDPDETVQLLAISKLWPVILYIQSPTVRVRQNINRKLNNDKSISIKVLLGMLKNNDYNEAVRLLDAITKCGVYFPEFDVIKRSAKHEQSKRI